VGLTAWSPERSGLAHYNSKAWVRIPDAGRQQRIGGLLLAVICLIFYYLLFFAIFRYYLVIFAIIFLQMFGLLFAIVCAGPKTLLLQLFEHYYLNYCT
jgi:hypothetical protein